MTKGIYACLVISALISTATHSCKTDTAESSSVAASTTSVERDFPAVQVEEKSKNEGERESEIDDDSRQSIDGGDSDMPRDLGVTEIFDNRCKLKWAGGHSVKQYRIYKLKDVAGAKPEFLGQIYVPSNRPELDFDVTGLDEESYYLEMEAVANSKVIKTLKPKKAIVAQNPQDKPSRPLDPRIIKTKSGGHEMHWKKPENPGRSEITGYVVQKSHTRNKDWKEFLTTDGPETRKEITLDPKDRFRVLAQNAAGLGEPSEIVYWNKHKYQCGHTKQVGGTVRRSTSSRTFTSWHDSPWNMHMQVSKQCVKSMGGEHPSFACAKSHQCGITLVPVHDDLEESNIVVTTAQCVVKEGTNDQKYEMAAIRIIARVSHMSDKLLDKLTNDYKPTNEDDPIVYYVEDVLPHPHYNHKTMENNIALARLNQVIEFDDHKRAICRQKATDKTKPKGKTDTLFNFVRPTENGLENVYLSIYEDGKCRDKAKSRTQFSFKEGQMFCGGGSEGSDHQFCLRDMGRGVACKPAGSKHNDEPWTLCGLTNYLIPDSQEDTRDDTSLTSFASMAVSLFFPGSQKCSQGAAFTSVYAHASWIDGEIVKFSKLFD